MNKLINKEKTNKQKPVWPFPPASGAIPWSKKQIASYEKEIKKSNHKQLPEAPF